ncbi:hypothetical protein PTE_01718 [Photorhabdus khanii NC19]|uniref:Uncharacterized protein n=1 Tax=Photorhabdus khanii NC19 TaxID=1004151 RepID=W3V7Z6_9GAMM|nr:hypothetical protein [Photorhabdus khanii]ETS31962.1 hypothetical protein PTE_01718 [Photorhabdus khanii NC19]
MDSRKKIVIKTDVNWSALAQLVTENALEKARWEIKPDITPHSLEGKRRSGVHQGVWEVVAKLLPLNQACAEKVARNLNPEPQFIHEFDWEGLQEHFNSLKNAKSWVKGVTQKRPSPLESLVPCGLDKNVKGKLGDKEEAEAWTKGRDYGIAEALLEGYLSDAKCTYEVMSADMYVPQESIHPLTIAKANLSEGGMRGFRLFLGEEEK